MTYILQETFGASGVHEVSQFVALVGAIVKMPYFEERLGVLGRRP